MALYQYHYIWVLCGGVKAFIFDAGARGTRLVKNFAYRTRNMNP